MNRSSPNFNKIHRATPVSESLLKLQVSGQQLHYKRDSDTGVFL